MDLPNNQRPAADGNKSEKKKIFRRRIGGTGKPAATANTNTGLNANNILNVRKALKIPSNFDAFAAKQMTSFKHSKAQEMFKERTKKFTCVEDDREQQRGGYSASTADGEEQTSYHTGIAFPISASLDLLDEKEREAIREYEERKNRKQPFTSSFAEFSAATSSSAFPPLLALGEGPEIFSTIPPFDPRIPPPVFPNQMATAFRPKKPVETPPTVEANQQPPQVSRSVKQETVELSIVDEIPSFQSSPSTSNLPPPPTNPIKTEAEFREDDCKKRKQALLWSLCEEELTVDSSIDTSTRRLDQISKKIEHYQKALTAEETLLKELKEKKTKLLTRRKRLLMSVEDSGGGAGTKEKR